nr:secretion protein HlyD [uncultured Selenomonas sp.]
MAQIFCPIEAANQPHSQSYVEDLLTISGQKRCAKMAWLN